MKNWTDWHNEEAKKHWALQKPHPGDLSIFGILMAILAGIFIAYLLVLVTPALSQQTIFRDDRGRTIGTVTTDSQGTKTFRDDRGHTTGTATTDSQGTTVFRDDRGRTTGSATSPRH